MLREDYENKFTTLNQPFEIGTPNKNGRLRLREIDIKNLKTDQLYPHRQVIRFNSTFVEVMDSWEFIRGRATALALPMWAALFFAISMFLFAIYSLYFKQVYWSIAIISCLTIGLVYLVYSNYKMAKYDLFGYTHYPIRFNQKTQKVYAFSPQQQKMIELNWRDLRFSAVKEGDDIELRASLVNADNIVEEEIIFPFLAPRYQPELVDQHLAFFKAYMQGGDLKRIDAAIPEFFDIYNRKETFKESFERVYMVNDIVERVQQKRPKERYMLSVSLNIIFWLPTLFLRRLGLLFSKIPEWPTHIEKECRIERNDTYDSTNKQRHLAPLKFSWAQILVIFLSGLILFSLAIVFFIGLAYLSWNYR
ncbi:DUF6708 domain-containing protein [Acinetobacter baylyi]|uniref:DUF6708 domain-containing protein n=1 Tax=Acinetobacter baylyi TaxID=202950 RepID=UPI0021C0074F|nr:DUF6708 domain-containing protein [Acinetobacter baylyi]UXJ56306.1 hypothetical protein N5P16_10450 [Acinetobacter baylyi]UXJ59127.1 hypothetical protein N5P13_08330 [Acinetobacter baylyi]